MGKGKPVSKSTITKYNTTPNKLTKFKETYKIKIKFSGLDLSFYNKVVKRLNKVEKKNQKQTKNIFDQSNLLLMMLN